MKSEYSAHNFHLSSVNSERLHLTFSKEKKERNVCPASSPCFETVPSKKTPTCYSST